ncbi:3-deoxy-7-phosphoheptulonate synthase [Rhodanobacter lindaniclasticus]
MGHEDRQRTAAVAGGGEARRGANGAPGVADPMHGNTESTSNGHKTRRFDNIRVNSIRPSTFTPRPVRRLGGVHRETDLQGCDPVHRRRARAQEVDLIAPTSRWSIRD